MAGGQPVSMANVREVSALCRSHGLTLVFDATRSSENAFFIKEREPGYAERSIVEILDELMGFADACVYSAKKDALVNIGGFLATRDQRIYEATCELVVKYEGLHTYGGMAGRDMEAVARGLREGADYDYLRYRIGQTQYLGRMLLAAGVPIVRPVGSHAVYLNALQVLPAHPPHRVAGSDTGRRPLRGFGRARHGARRGFEGEGQGHWREHLSAARTGPAHDSAARVHEHAYGIRRRLDCAVVRPEGADSRPRNGARAARAPLLPGAIQAGEGDQHG